MSKEERLKGSIKEKRNLQFKKELLNLPIGKELSQLIHYILEYSHKYEKLKEVIDYHVNSNDIGIKQVILRKRLKERGWKTQEKNFIINQWKYFILTNSSTISNTKHIIGKIF